MLLVYRHKGPREKRKGLQIVLSVGVALTALLQPSNMLNTTEEEGSQI